MGIRKNIKLEDIANELGVSVVTVSNALNNRKGVSEHLKKSIEEKAKQMGYESSNKENEELKVRKIGVVIADRYVIEFPSFYMEIYRNIVKVADLKHSLTILEVVDREKETLVKKKTSFTDFDVDGIILVGELEDSYIKWLSSVCNVPFVCVDFYRLDKGFDYFISDNFRGMCMATQCLIDAGHTDIGFVGNPQATTSIMDRYMGYLRALKKNGIKYNENRLYLDRSSENDGGLEVELNINDLPTAFACNCDMVAFLTIEKLNKMGLKVPEDISIASFDNYYYKKNDDIRLTTYENDTKALAQVSVNTLMKRIEKNKKPEGVRIIHGKIIEGNSIKDIRGAYETYS